MEIYGLDVDVDGNVVFLMRLTGVVDLGGWPIDSLGADIIVLAKLNPDGSLAWNTQYEGENVVVDSAGDIIVSGGSVISKLDATGVELWRVDGGEGYTDAGVHWGALAVDPVDREIYAGLVKLNPDGTEAWRIADCIWPRAAAVHGDDVIYVGGFTGMATADGNSDLITSHDTDVDIFVMRVTTGGL